MTTVTNYRLWWQMFVIADLLRLRQKDCEFERSLDYIVGTCHKKESFHRNFPFSNTDWSYMRSFWTFPTGKKIEGT
jgi:hypothetical protein